MKQNRLNQARKFSVFFFNFHRYLFYHHFAEAVAQSCSVKKVIPRNFAKLTGKHLCQSLFINQVAGRPVTLLKKRHWHRSFPVNLQNF